MVSLNSWMIPRLIIQGYEPSEIVYGGPGEIGKLETVLEKMYSNHRRRSDSLIPRAAAVGYFTYEGAFRFGLYKNLTALNKGQFSPFWTRRKNAWQNPPTTKRTPFAWIEPESGWFAELTQAQYEGMVTRAKQYIAQGDVYQVNLCQKFTKTFMGNPYELFEHLLIASPSPGLVFMDLGDHQVLSASPEMFLKIQGRHITTRPIKGTRPRHENPLKDEQNAIDLMNDPKELAELLMITDLERNDLGKVCEIGSMKATATPVLETFAQVFHLVSTVEGDLTEGVTPLMAIRSCMPGGSITGAPKIRACEIIKELEPCPRGLYTGALGYFDENGDAAFSIAIRTMILHQNQLSLSVGAGITADSDPTSEYLETIAKARGAWKSLNSYIGARKTAAK